MEPKERSKENMLLHRLGGVSQNMIKNHKLENLSEFVLYDLCAGDLFDISKAAYFVNNSDFACMKGVVGHSHQHKFNQPSGWNSQKEFIAHMKQSDFNNRVRAISDKSFKAHEMNLSDKRMRSLADQLEIENPACHVWDMKYDNQGFLLYEKPQFMQEIDEHMQHFVPMLSFCSVF